MAHIPVLVGVDYEDLPKLVKVSFSDRVEHVCSAHMHIHSYRSGEQIILGHFFVSKIERADENAVCGMCAEGDDPHEAEPNILGVPLGDGRYLLE